MDVGKAPGAVKDDGPNVREDAANTEDAANAEGANAESVSSGR